MDRLQLDLRFAGVSIVRAKSDLPLAPRPCFRALPCEPALQVRLKRHIRAEAGVRLRRGQASDRDNAAVPGFPKMGIAARRT